MMSKKIVSAAPETIDLVFSLDTTGSTRAVALQARQNIKKTVAFLFKRIPDLRIGAFFHGDWADSNRLTTLDLTDNEAAIIDFIKTAPSTSGRGIGAMYEGIFHEARGLNWTSGRNKALVLLADTYPHMGGSADNAATCECGGWHSDTASKSHPHYNWRNELGLLNESNITVMPVRLLAHYNSEADFFYNGIQAATGNPVIELEQFEDVSDLIMAVCMKRAGKLDEFEQHLCERGHTSVGTRQIISTLGGTKFDRFKNVRDEYAAKGLTPVAASRFQQLHVDRDILQEDFVAQHGAQYSKGRGFYEFTKSIILRPGREVLVQDRRTGALFTGVEARRLLGLPASNSGNITVRPGDRTWRGFIQSTSPVRKLLKGTIFLYEVDK